MRGIAELEEVSNAPTTPSSVPSSVVPPSAQFNGMVASAEPPEEVMEEDSCKTPEPPVAKPPPHSEEAPPTSTSGSSFAKMRNMLAQQMGVSTDKGGEVKGNGNVHSPSHSPVVQHKGKPGAAPPLPKRGTQSSLIPNKHSPSSSTSSVSSSQSERVPGSHDLRGSVEVPIATQQQIMTGAPHHSHRGEYNNVRSMVERPRPRL